VCGRALGHDTVIDGVRCIVCAECEIDPFRRAHAVEKTTGVPVPCPCSGCQHRVNGAGRQLAMPLDGVPP
jgi:hypothetical protein